MSTYCSSPTAKLPFKSYGNCMDKHWQSPETNQRWDNARAFGAEKTSDVTDVTVVWSSLFDKVKLVCCGPHSKCPYCQSNERLPPSKQHTDSPMACTQSRLKADQTLMRQDSEEAKRCAIKADKCGQTHSGTSPSMAPSSYGIHQPTHPLHVLAMQCCLSMPQEAINVTNFQVALWLRPSSLSREIQSNLSLNADDQTCQFWNHSVNYCVLYRNLN